MLAIVSLVLFYFLLPIAIIALCQRYKSLNKLGAVVLAYIVGLTIGSVGIIPKASDSLRYFLKSKAALPADEISQLLVDGKIAASDVIANNIAFAQDKLMTVAILLAIPLLLFSLDLKKWLKMAGEAIFSLFLALASLIASIFIGYYFFHDKIDEAWKISGMLVGLYTGGTANLAAIGTGLGVSANNFLLTHTYDMAIGILLLLFLVSYAQRLFIKFLPSFSAKHAGKIADLELDQNNDIDSFLGMLSKHGIFEILKGFGLASLIVAVSGTISYLVPEKNQFVTVILSITTLGLLLSNWKVVNRIGNTFQLGMYFIIVFSLVVSSMGDLTRMFHIEYIHLFSFVALVVVGSVVIHVFLSFLFRVDADTTIITITALTYSPPFVPVVAGALKNKNIIISGLTVGILGYAIGNYLGLVIAYFLEP
ncbi:MAG: DUF819 family protein [Cyclobacteriaceae bacterium]|nr:DUF819 family protein [Cyclobacteriaceae bacterium]